MIKLRLCGWLGKKYGKNFTLRGNTVKEAVDMLCANFKDFRKDFVGNQSKYKITVGNEEIEEQEAFLPAKSINVKITPYFGGSGNIARIVAGIVLVVVGEGASPVAMMGWSLILGGAVGLLFGTPSTKNSGSEDSSKTSYLFGGTVNTTGQGNPVPILYGKRRIGSQVISAGISSVMA